MDFNDYQRYKMHEATKKFRASEEYTLLKKKKARAYEDLDNKSDPGDFEFIDECIGIFAEEEYQKMEFVYDKAYRECVSLLKELTILRLKIF